MAADLDAQGVLSLVGLSQAALRGAALKRFALQYGFSAAEVRLAQCAAVLTLQLRREARLRSGLSQQQFADVLGVSRRTLEAWEQGRRNPTGAARSLLAIAARRPQVLRDVLAAA